MNNLDNNTFDLPRLKFDRSSGQDWTIFSTLLCLLLGGITFATIIGNLLVLYLFKKSKRGLRTPTHYLIANLAVADLQVGVAVMPILTSLTLNDFKWYWGETACTLREYGHFFLCATSMVSMMAISIERYIGVRFPLRHKRILSKGRVLKVILLIWALGFILSATPLTLWPIQGKYPPDICPVNLTSNFVFFISVCMYWIPVTSTAIVYFCIYKRAVKLWVPPNTVKANSTQMLSSMTNRSVNSGTALAYKKPKGRRISEQDRLIEIRNKQIKFAKKLFLIVVIMLVLYAPLFITFLMAGINQSFISPFLLLTVGWIRYFSSTVNPFLYICVVPGYKKAFLKALWNEKSSLNSSHTSAMDANGSSTSGSSSSSSPVKITTKTNPSPIISKKVGMMKGNENRDVVKHGHNIMPSRFCSFCGNTLISVGDGQPFATICSICFKKVPLQPHVTFSDVEKAKKDESNECVLDAKLLYTEVQSAPRKLSCLSVYQDSLVSEMRRFLAAMNDEPGLDAENGELCMRKNSAEKLITNLKTEFPDQFRNKVKLLENRKSIFEGVRIVAPETNGNRNNTSIEIDLEAMKELDEIIKQLESR